MDDKIDDLPILSILAQHNISYDYSGILEPLCCGMAYSEYENYALILKPKIYEYHDETNIDEFDNSFPHEISIRFHHDFVKQNELKNCIAVFDSYEDKEFTKPIDNSHYETRLYGDDWVHYEFAISYKSDTTYIRLCLINEQGDRIHDMFYFLFQKAYGRNYDNVFTVKNGWLYELHPKTKAKRHTSFHRIVEGANSKRTHKIIQTHVDYCDN